VQKIGNDLPYKKSNCTAKHTAVTAAILVEFETVGGYCYFYAFLLYISHQTHYFVQKGTVKMTENEKKLKQAQHRLEQAQNRNRDKVRKARTRRLIQEGAILEKILPDVTAIKLNDLELYLRSNLRQ